MLEYSRNYVRENTQMTRWLLKPAKLAEHQALKDQKYKACCEKINLYERKTLMKKDSSQIVEGLDLGLWRTRRKDDPRTLHGSNDRSEQESRSMLRSFLSKKFIIR